MYSGLPVFGIAREKNNPMRKKEKQMKKCYKKIHLYFFFYGQITRKHADHTIEVPNVLAGTQYRVEERGTENPDGYSFQRYADYDTGTRYSPPAFLRR